MAKKLKQNPVKQNLDLIAQMYDTCKGSEGELRMEDPQKRSEFLFMQKMDKVLTADDRHDVHNKTGFKDANDIKREEAEAKRAAMEAEKAAKEAEKAAAKEAKEAEKAAAEAAKNEENNEEQ